MRIVTYECEECGTEVVVTETGGTSLMPIYCCGLEVTEISSVPKSGGVRKKTAGKRAIASTKGVKKATKKVAAKRTTRAAGTAGKKPSSSRKTAKKK